MRKILHSANAAFRANSVSRLFILLAFVFSAFNTNAQLVFSEGFETFPPTGWVNTRGATGNNWATSTSFHWGSKSALYAFHSTQAATAWLISPAVTLTAGVTYNISYWENTLGLTEKLKVTVGTAQTIAGQTTVLQDNTALTNTSWALKTTTYTPTTTGTYYFGFNCYSAANKWNLYLDDIYISKYCYSYPTTTTWGFKNITFNTINNTTTAGTGYNNYVSQSTTVTPGLAYNLSATVSTNGNYTYYQYAWIDWNQNGSFADAGETYNLGSATNNSNAVSSLCPLSITVPAGATAGNTVMRVSSKYNVATATAYCSSYDGEIEDYTINVLPATPTLTGSALTAFGSVCPNTTSNPNSFTITGTALTSANVTVGALSGYTYSTTSGGTYTTSLSLTQPGGSYSQTIFVKFTPAAVQSYNGNIPVGGGGAPSINVAASGSGVNLAPTVTSGSASAVTSSSATVAGSISSTGCTSVTAYGIEYSTTSGFANGAGTPVAGSNLSGGNFSVGLSSLAANTTYYYHAYATNGGGTGYGSQGSFTTACTAANIPYTQDFQSVTVPAIPSCNSIQNAGSGNNWITSNNPGYGFTSKTLQYTYHSSNAANAWFFTQGLNLVAGKSYRLSYRYGGTGTTYPEKLKVAYGTSATAAAMTTVLANYNPVDNASAYSDIVLITPSSTGVYYIGFNAYSDANEFYLFVDDISVTDACASLQTYTIGATTNPICQGQTLNLTNTAPTATFSQAESPNATVPNASFLNEGVLSRTLTISGSGLMASDILSTDLKITYTENDDLDIWLYAPDGWGIALSTNNGGSGDNYNNVKFIASAATNISAYNGVNTNFTGNYKPQTAFSNLTGPADGTWTLIVYNTTYYIIGTPAAAVLNSWGINFNKTPTLAWTGPNGFSSSSSNPNITNAQPAASGNYTFKATYPNGCVVNATPNPLSVTVTPTVGVPTTIGIVSGADPTCQLPNGTTQTVYSTSATDATSYTWSISPATGVGTISGTGTQATVTWTNGASGAVTIGVKANGCNGPSAQTNRSFTINPTLTPSVTLADNSANGNGAAMCDAANITYTATAVNPGSAPNYDFQINNVSVQSGSSNTFVTSAVNNGNTVKCILTSNATPCLGTPTATSNVITATITACGYTWTGAGANHLWTNAANWSPAVPPNTCGSNVNIPSVVNYPVLTGNVTLGDVNLADAATLDIGNNTLSACGSWAGGASTAGTVTGTGSVILNGTGAQGISGKTTFNKLIVNKTAGLVTVTGNAALTTALVMQRGDLTNSGTVILKSSAGGTAYLDNFTSGTAGTYTGNLTVERYIANGSQGYRDISSPVASTVADWAADFNVVGQNDVYCWYSYVPYPSLQYYNESDNSVTDNYYGGWISYTNNAQALTAGKGYAARIYNAPLTINTTGTPNNGAKSIPLTKTTSTVTSADGWNLVGNPYPSPISWTALRALNPGITTASHYRFSTSGEYAGTWAAHNGTTGTNGATDEIGSSQGFFVLAVGTNVLNFNNGVRTTGASPFFKTRTQTDEIRLELGNGTMRDEIVAYTDPAATSGFDEDFDATKIPAGSTLYMSFKQPDKEYAINVLDQITEATELPLLVWVTDTGSYTITATELNLGMLVAYLKDAQTGILYDLTIGAPGFVLNGNQDYTGRFSVVFKMAEVSGIKDNGQSAIRIYSAENKVYIERSSNAAATIEISNMLGQQITQVISNNVKTEISLHLPGIWYAFVKVQEGDKVKTAKVLIDNK